MRSILCMPGANQSDKLWTRCHADQDVRIQRTAVPIKKACDGAHAIPTGLKKYRLGLISRWNVLPVGIRDPSDSSVERYEKRSHRAMRWIRKCLPDRRRGTAPAGNPGTDRRRTTPAAWRSPPSSLACFRNSRGSESSTSS